MAAMAPTPNNCETSIDLLIGRNGNHVVDDDTEINNATANAGVDTVVATVNYVSDADQENLTLGSTSNSGANVLHGNYADSTLGEPRFRRIARLSS